MRLKKASSWQRRARRLWKRPTHSPKKMRRRYRIKWGK